MNEEIRQRTKWFMDARFGMFIHWGLYSIPACGEWMMSEKEMTTEEYHIHGAAADRAAALRGEYGMLPQDLFARLGRLFAEHHR